jgi:hypothetical protein
LIASGIAPSWFNPTRLSDPVTRLPRIRNSLLRRELPWLVADVVLLLILFNANAPELWFWLVVLLVILAYRYERWWSSRAQNDDTPD